MTWGAGLWVCVWRVGSIWSPHEIAIQKKTELEAEGWRPELSSEVGLVDNQGDDPSEKLCSLVSMGMEESGA